MKRLKLLSICLLVWLSGEAQDVARKTPSFKEIRIGEICPDVEMTGIVNFSRSSSKISDFKGKLLILDFWATWCSPCVAAFPKLDSLQNQFSGKIQILPITAEPTEKVALFYSKMAISKKVLPPSVTGDKILANLFQHLYLPHCVWINGDGKVIAITDGKEVTEANIKRALQSGTIDLKVKKDKVYRIVNESATMFVPGVRMRQEDSSVVIASVRPEKMLIHSSFSGYLEDLPGSGFKTADSNSARLWNVPVFRLYHAILWRFGPEMFNESTIKLEIPDSSLYHRLWSNVVGLEYADWLSKNGYCYEIQVHSSLASQKADIALAELNRYFGALYGIEGVLEKREQRYLALLRTTDEDKLASKGGQPGVQQNSYFIKMTNVSMNRLFYALARPLQKHPIIVDETGYKQKVDLEINCNLTDLESLNNELAKYGLELKEKTRMANLAIIRMKK